MPGDRRVFTFFRDDSAAEHRAAGKMICPVGLQMQFSSFKLMESRREIKALFGYAFELFAGMKSGFQNTDAVS